MRLLTKLRRQPVPPAATPEEVEQARPKQRVPLREAFTPTRPQPGTRRFVGRRAEFGRIMQALEEERAHVVLYAERGRGKTSLSNLVIEAARGAGYMVARYTCEAASDFETIFRGLMRDLPSPLLAVAAVDDPALDGCEAALPAGALRPRDVMALPSRLAGQHLVLVVDEFDRLEDATTRTQLADVIKQASDRALAMSLMIVGVSDNLEQLVGRHPSIQRAIVGVPLPLLSAAEIESIVHRGGVEAGVMFPQRIQKTIATLARGVPYVAQLLGLRAAQAAAARQDESVSGGDLAVAVRRVVAESDARSVAVYDQLTNQGTDTVMATALRDIAAAEADAFGRFIAERADGGGVLVAGVPLDMSRWDRLVESGAIRGCASPIAGLITFNEALLANHILLRAAAGSSGEDAARRAA